MSRLGNEIERSRSFWNRRYSIGGNSGTSGKDYEWEIINKHVPSINHVVDVGCGDLGFWNYKPCPDYVGIDISEKIIKLNEARTRGMEPRRIFFNQPAEELIPNLSRENAICMDVLFHILEKENFEKILKNLTSYASKRIILTVWDESPFIDTDTDGEYQRYFDFKEQIPVFQSSGFRIVGNYLVKLTVANPQPGLKDELRKRIYVFEK